MPSTADLPLGAARYSDSGSDLQEKGDEYRDAETTVSPEYRRDGQIYDGGLPLPRCRGPPERRIVVERKRKSKQTTLNDSRC